MPDSGFSLLSRGTADEVSLALRRSIIDRDVDQHCKGLVSVFSHSVNMWLNYSFSRTWVCRNQGHPLSASQFICVVRTAQPFGEPIPAERPCFTVEREIAIKPGGNAT